MRVLIATNDRTFTPSLVMAYLARRWEVATGIENLFHRSAVYDLIHLHWPEELTGWRCPDQRALDRASSALEWWRRRTRILATVHNLLPHGREQSEPDRALYRIVYAAANAIGHFSKYSLGVVEQEFPDLGRHKHIVHPPFAFDDLGRQPCDREAARRNIGLDRDEFAILTFGALRHKNEVRLIRAGIGQANVAKKRTVFAARLPPAGRMTTMLRYLDNELKRRATHAIVLNDSHVADEDLASLFEAVDAVVIPRCPPHLNSGVLSLAMTFGTPVVAPRYGVYQEYLSNTDNELYQPNDPADMARAIERLAKKPHKKLVVANRSVAAGWGWPMILDSILPKILR